MLEGREISRYRLGPRIDTGGMGVVYETDDLTLGRQAALKCLPPDLKQNPLAVERFKLEARSASALNHPNICTITTWRRRRRAVHRDGTAPG
jgi:serine/threonine protein kinase